MFRLYRIAETDKLNATPIALEAGQPPDPAGAVLSCPADPRQAPSSRRPLTDSRSDTLGGTPGRVGW